ncbi:interferon gamma receptor 2 precursor [Esox lucius]|uniref:interferon gamma receptor 2 precursor n=1 Tax=Esox lucius TaxID=8010 RepID=UPI000576C3AD|nr:interferon gamma receptor 2 precursor [Esox lucius]
MFCLKCVLSSWIVFQVITQAWSQEVPPPRDVRVDTSGVRWSPYTDRPGVKYTVQSQTDRGEWRDIKGCVKTERTTCDNVSACLMVRVWAQQGNHRSESVQACTHAMSCSPEVQLTAQAGLLLVTWRKNNNLSEEYADHFQYQVEYGREGEELKGSKRSRSSVMLQNLDVGGKYCVQARYTCYQKAFGIPSPSQCAIIPESESTKRIRISLICVFISVLLGTVAVGLIFLFHKHYEKIKQLHPRPLRLPDHYREFFNGDFNQQLMFPTSTSSPTEEHHDTISIVVSEDDQIDSSPNSSASDGEQGYNTPNEVESSAASLGHYE